MSSQALVISSQDSSSSSRSQEIVFEVENSATTNALKASSFGGGLADESSLENIPLDLSVQIGLDYSSEPSTPKKSVLHSLDEHALEAKNPFIENTMPQFKRINFEGGEAVLWNSQEQQTIAPSELDIQPKIEPINLEKTQEVILHSPQQYSPPKREPWNQDELTALQEGLLAHGHNWNRILQDHGPEGTISCRLSGRDNVQLKDKARLLNGGERYYSEPRRAIRQIRNRWSTKELSALEHGMATHGTRWASILADHGVNGRIDQNLANRSQVQLKDKARSERTARERDGRPLGVFALACSHL